MPAVLVIWLGAGAGAEDTVFVANREFCNGEEGDETFGLGDCWTVGVGDAFGTGEDGNKDGDDVRMTGDVKTDKLVVLVGSFGAAGEGGVGGGGVRDGANAGATAVIGDDLGVAETTAVVGGDLGIAGAGAGATVVDIGATKASGIGAVATGAGATAGGGAGAGSSG